MKRRDLLLLAGTTGLGLGAQAQVLDLNDAINKAGRQRMLSQRMAKAWLALVHKTESASAQLVLDRSMALFDRQLVELKTYAPNAELRKTETDLNTALEGAPAAQAETAAAPQAAADAPAESPAPASLEGQPKP